MKSKLFVGGCLVAAGIVGGGCLDILGHKDRVLDRALSTGGTGGTAGSGGATGGTTTSGPAVCGNGEQEAGEECDDENLVDADGCEADCTLPSCGNGIVDPGELCLTAQKTVSFQASDVRDIVLVDCDSDANLDIVVSCAVNSYGGLFAFRNAKGSFDEQIYSESGLDNIGLSVSHLTPDVFELVSVDKLKARTTWHSSSGNCHFGYAVGLPDDYSVNGPADIVTLNANGNENPDAAKIFNSPNGNSSRVDLTIDHDPGLHVVGPSFYSPKPQFIAAGDLVGDSLDDLLVPGDKRLLLFENKDGVFSDSFLPFDVPTAGLSSDPADAALGDLDLDGDSDIVTADTDTSTIGVLRNLGQGAFAASVPEPSVEGSNGVAAAKPRSIALGDLNNDGFLDAITANSDDSTGKSSVSVFLNDGTGKLVLATKASFPLVGVDAPFEVGRQPVSVKVGDLNGDGVPDIATANAYVENGMSSVSVLLSNP